MFLVSRFCLGFRSHVVIPFRDFFFFSFRVWFLGILVIFYVDFRFCCNVWVFTGGLDSLCFLRTFFLVIAYFLLVNPI